METLATQIVERTKTEPGRVERIFTTEIQSDTVYISGPDSSAIASFPSWASVHVTKESEEMRIDLLNYRTGAAQSHVLHLPREESDFSLSTGSERPLNFRAERDLGIGWEGDISAVVPVYGPNPSPRLEVEGPIAIKKGAMYIAPGASMNLEGDYQLEVKVGYRW